MCFSLLADEVVQIYARIILGFFLTKFVVVISDVTTLILLHILVLVSLFSSQGSRWRGAIRVLVSADGNPYSRISLCFALEVTFRLPAVAYRSPRSLSRVYRLLSRSDYSANRVRRLAAGGLKWTRTIDLALIRRAL